MNLADRIKICVDRANSGEVYAKAIGIPRRTLGNYLAGVSEPKASVLAKMAQVSGVSVDWLVTGTPRHGPAPGKGTLHSKLVRRYDVQLSAGSGSISDRAEELTPIPFAPDFFSKKLGGRNPDRMVIVDARGDSMVPTLGDGDLVMIDTSEVDVRDAIYAVSYGDALFIKRLAKRGDRIDLISSNPEYPVERIEGPDLAQLEIIGRVVWIGRALV
ncbi:hypothetical protein AN189_12910 [Loktanella sp. 3ANDIMAR09]|uniref:XRE family transcriptional regulator n=1 Tax=Loktanella sp. 3ANDIMAR09 TaxID=1225657 RepID=UPI000707FA91|nr:S24 family peptidase [Loktanella sp. 3ANDIMAR09]KQI67974.1 hypothetical protein AN189_12910 [Loktanella sp. 3ANDIMAR09]